MSRQAKRTKTKPAYKLVEVYKVKDAIGAYCLDCQQVFGNGTESQGKKHKVILVGIE